jgi:hypothetical protein
MNGLTIRVKESSVEDKFLVVVIDDLNIVRKQRLCDTYKQAQKVQEVWEDYHLDVRIQLLYESESWEDWKVVTLPDNWA